MAETPDERVAIPGAPSDVLMALYMGDHDRAKALAVGLALSLPELAAFGDLAGVSTRATTHPDALHDLSPDGWTALHLAAYFGYASVVIWLLRAGASHAARSHNAQGNTPLHAAIAGRHKLPVVTALLAAGSDPSAADAQGYRPLHLAASRGAQAITELLMALGADPSALTADGQRALDLALAHDHTDLAAFLTPSTTVSTTASATMRTVTETA